MPSIKDESTVKAIAREFCSNGRKKGLALREIGYTDSYSVESGRGPDVVFSNVHVKAEIAKIDGEKQEKADYDYNKAMEEINALIDTLKKQVKSGNLSAKSLLLAAIKEKNNITGLQKRIFVDETPQDKELDAISVKEAEEFAQWRLRRMLKAKNVG